MKSYGATCILLSFKWKTWSHLPGADEKKCHPRLEDWWGSHAVGNGKESRAGVQDPWGCSQAVWSWGTPVCFALSGFLSVYWGLEQICLAFVHHWPFQLSLCLQSMSLLTSEWGGAVTWGGSALPWMGATEAEQSPWGCSSIEWQPLCSVTPCGSSWLLGSLLLELLVFGGNPTSLNLSAVGTWSFYLIPSSLSSGINSALSLCTLPTF